MSGRAHASADVRGTLADRASGDAYPAWKDADGRKTALMELVIATPVQPEADVEQVARNLTANGETAAQRARMIGQLDAVGWAMTPPFTRVDTDGQGDGSHYLDVIVQFRKRFATSEEAIDEVRTCGPGADLGFSFGWNETGGEVEFWTEP